jgi:oxygen-independent coproporphyrinogen-3 oxidase
MVERARMTVDEDTGVGSYFVANYPPFSVWTPDAVAAEARPALGRGSSDRPALGLYLHIPFCRKRCHFCYFRVYTDRNAQQVSQYLDTIAREWELFGRTPAIAGREIDFVYFGGGTPSFLSTQQLEGLVSRLVAVRPWTSAREITFECEPGTLTEAKLEVIRALGVTRLSLGVESFDDRILELNGRAHRSPEIERAYRFARRLDFAQINIDLIAGMLGETDEDWRHSVERALALEPDSVTIYQMELPFNTTISGDRLRGEGRFAEPVASWPTKRRWVSEAFDAFLAAGYRPRSAYTLVRDPARTTFVYTDRVWDGADLVGLGVASFGHVSGVHMQNADTWEAYRGAIDRGELALARAYRPTDEERLIREFILQLKRGVLKPSYFAGKYGVDVLARFAQPLSSLAADGMIEALGPDEIRLSRDGLLQVDVLLRRFYLPQHAEVRYT